MSEQPEFDVDKFIGEALAKPQPLIQDRNWPKPGSPMPKIPPNPITQMIAIDLLVAARGGRPLPPCVVIQVEGGVTAQTLFDRLVAMEVKKDSRLLAITTNPNAPGAVLMAWSDDT